MFEKQPGFNGFNFNLGCPAPNFVNHGVGCAMIKRVSKTKKLVNIKINNIKIFDLVEINPKKGNIKKTVKIVKEIFKWKK